MFSIIIPTYNEAENIAHLVSYLRTHANESSAEIIVVDAGSTDNTLVMAAQAGAVAVLSPRKGRAAQMNYGASIARGSVLYFIHADAYPPNSFVADIEKAVAEGYELGRYRTRFNSRRLILKMNAFFTRFDLFICYGGDQTLFITRSLFKELGGFNDTMRIMEDYEIVVRARKRARYRILPGSALISARKYDTNSWWKVQKANYTIVKMYKKGASQEEMVNRYKQMLVYR